MKRLLIITITVISLIVLGVGLFIYIRLFSHPSGAGASKESTRGRISDDPLLNDTEHYTDYTLYESQYYSKFDLASDYPGHKMSVFEQSKPLYEMVSICKEVCTKSKDCKFFTVATQTKNSDSDNDVSDCHLYKNATNLKPFKGNEQLKTLYSEVNSYKKR